MTEKDIEEAQEQGEKVVEELKEQFEAAGSRGTQMAQPPDRGITELRQEYEQRVGLLAQLAAELLAAEVPMETVARRVHAARRDLTQEYKERTPEPLRGRIRARTLVVYGDEIGPTVEFLREGGADWIDIVRAAGRTGPGLG